MFDYYWQIKFNEKKCKVLRIGKNPPEYSYSMTNSTGQNVPLEETTCEKDLGVWIDQELSFKHHTAIACKKANSILGLIRRTFKHLDSAIMSQLYMTLVRPHLEYGNSVWWPALKGQRNELEKVQHRATKLIPAIKHLPYEERLATLNIPTIAFRHLRGNMINTYKYATAKYNCELLEFNTTSMTRSNGYKLAKRRCAGVKYQNFYTNSIVDTWNALPAKVVSADTVDQFKNRLDKHWRTHPMRTNPTASSTLPPPSRADFII